jgi:hypothetical protein
MRGSGILFMPILLIALVSAAFIATHRHHVSPHEAAMAETEMASHIRDLERDNVHAKTLVNVRCTHTSTWPKIFGNDPGDAFNCLATFTTASQGWCVLYDPAHTTLITDYQGLRMCEGPPNPMIEP